MEHQFWHSATSWVKEPLHSATQGPHLSTNVGLGKLWGPIQPLTTSDFYVRWPRRSYRKTHTKTQQILSSVNIWILLICLLPCSLKTRDSQTQEGDAGWALHALRRGSPRETCLPGTQGHMDGLRYMCAEAFIMSRETGISVPERPQCSSPPPPNLFSFDWRRIASQHCVGLCRPSAWVSHRNTRAPPIPLGCHRAPGWDPWVTQQIPIGSLFYTW